ncbi:hypothetical protein NpNSSI1_00000446 [Neofusicoccum parvum]|nr:hypothetical protein NpNSSI1_00000446 [Neofusicoccum parvum]
MADFFDTLGDTLDDTPSLPHSAPPSPPPPPPPSPTTGPVPQHRLPISSLTTATTPSTAAWALSPNITRSIRVTIRASIRGAAHPRIHARHACLALAKRHLLPVLSDADAGVVPFPPGATGAMRLAVPRLRRGWRWWMTADEMKEGLSGPVGCGPPESRMGDVWSVDAGAYGGIRVEWKDFGAAGLEEGVEEDEDEEEEMVESSDQNEEAGNDDNDDEHWDENGGILLDGVGEAEAGDYYGLMKDYDGDVSDSDSDSDSEMDLDEDEQEDDGDKFDGFDGDHTGGHDTGDHEHPGNIGQAK